MAEERMPTPAAGFLLVTQEYNHQKPWFGFHSKKKKQRKKGQAFFGMTSLLSETMFHPEASLFFRETSFVDNCWGIGACY